MSREGRDGLGKNMKRLLNLMGYWAETYSLRGASPARMLHSNPASFKALEKYIAAARAECFGTIDKARV